MVSTKEWLLNHSDLLMILHYSPDTGLWTWQVDVGNVHAGDVAGCINEHGYCQIRINRITYRGARLVVFYMTKKWPVAQVDHINGQRSDDRWDNLREAIQQQNNRNRRRLKNNTSGYTGVTFVTRMRKFRAQVKIGGKFKYLGYFDTAEEAAAVYEASAKEQFGEFYPDRLN